MKKEHFRKCSYYAVLNPSLLDRSDSLNDPLLAILVARYGSNLSSFVEPAAADSEIVSTRLRRWIFAVNDPTVMIVRSVEAWPLCYATPAGLGFGGNLNTGLSKLRTCLHG